VDRKAEDTCEMAIRVNDRPSLEKEARFLMAVDKNCSCPKGIFVDIVMGGILSSVKAKVCHIPMPMQKLPTLRILSPLQDMAAYPAMEVDRHMHGRLSHALGHNGNRWLDVGANLGVLSISLALANPNATGVALEPNPTAFAFLQRNIAAYGLTGRITAINAGLSRDGASLQMPRCVVTALGGSQMASTQWGGSPVVSKNSCFSAACKKRAAAVRQCMANDPGMVSVPSLSLEAALARAAPPPAQAAGSSLGTDASLASLALGSGQHLSAAKAAPPGLALLKVDCQGCEHQVMDALSKLKASKRVHRIIGECHALTGLTDAQKASCLRVLRGVECSPDRISPYLTCGHTAVALGKLGRRLGRRIVARRPGRAGVVLARRRQEQ